jgi:hypothetical protein
MTFISAEKRNFSVSARETNKAKEGMKSSDCLFVSCDNKMQMGNYIQYLKQVLIYLGSSI